MDSPRHNAQPGRPEVAIVSPRVIASFVQQDADLLGESFHTTLIPVSGPASLVRLHPAMCHADVAILWFLGRHAIPAILLARAYRVPVISVVGGFEVAWEADIKYGVRPGSIRESVLRWMLRSSAAIITVSEFSRGLAMQRFPEHVDRMVMIHNAVDTSKFNYIPGGPRSGVLCVATLTSSSIKVKNLDILRGIALAMPETPFVLVGPALDSEARDFVSRLPSNIHWKGRLVGDELVSAYQNASVYVQLSRHESFSLALAESMACGCVPVVSLGGALPEVGGIAAQVLTDLMPQTCVRAIRRAMLSSEDDRRRAREHVLARFGTDLRRDRLVELIDNLMKS